MGRKPKDPNAVKEPRSPELEQKVSEWEKMRGQSPLQEALESLGLIPQIAALHLMEELGATVTKAQYDPAMGRWTYSRPHVDWAARQKARQDLTRYWGAFKESDKDDSPLVVEIRDCTKESGSE
jgi:hypothetical protein